MKNILAIILSLIVCSVAIYGCMTPKDSGNLGTPSVSDESNPILPEDPNLNQESQFSIDYDSDPTIKWYLQQSPEPILIFTQEEQDKLIKYMANRKKPFYLTTEMIIKFLEDSK